MSQTANGFKFTKWYVDVLDNDGNGIIGYKASLHWKQIRLGYEGLIPIGNRFQGEGSFTSAREPAIKGDTLSWDAKYGSGKWTMKRSLAPRFLLQNGIGTIHWDCIQSKSDVRATIQGQHINGSGYVEKIEMTLPPWQMPINELFWGRFLSPHHDIVWIKWVGPHPRLLIIQDGLETQGTVDEKNLTIDDMSVDLPHRTFRKGTVGESVFSGFPMIAGLFPDAIMKLHEEKWSGKAMLRKGNKVIDEGSVIHEKVIWP